LDSHTGYQDVGFKIQFSPTFGIILETEKDSYINRKSYVI